MTSQFFSQNCFFLDHQEEGRPQEEDCSQEEDCNQEEEDH